jgi:acyl carrier protein
MANGTDNIKENIRAFIVNDLLFGQGQVADDASFLENGIIDSTGVLQLVAHIESTFGIKVADEELTPENLDTINSVSAYLQGKLAAQLRVSE